MDHPAIYAIGGLPGSGKTSVIQPYLAQGFSRVNRDETGGKLDSPDTPFYHEVRRLFGQGVRRFVFDNTFCFPEQRAVLVQVARELGLPVHLRMLDVDVPKAQLFASRRQVQRYGKLFRKEDYKTHKADENMFPPSVQFAFEKALKSSPPSTAEGFASVEVVPVPVVWGPEYTRKALILDYDGTLRLTKGRRVTKRGKLYPTDPDDIDVLPGRSEVLKRMQAEGWLLLGASNQSGCSYSKDEDPDALTEEQAQACFKRTNELLGVDIDVLYAVDRGGPPSTFWRKPCPGMGVVHIEKYKLDPAKCIMVGDMGTDQTFAERCGFQFAEASQFFAQGGAS